MRIIIDYEASWRNSFLDGSNNEPLPKKGRNYVASMTELKKPENYIQRTVSKSTVLGILSRLIGDQRKLYQARQSEHFYFKDIEDVIHFEDKPKVVNNEIAYLRNMKGSTDQNSFTGMIKVNDPIFQSDYSQEFWGVLALDMDELCDFILNDIPVTASLSLDPISIINRLDYIKQQKFLEYEGNVKLASDKLSNAFEKYSPFDKQGRHLILPMYCSALYLQIFRLEEKYKIDLPKASRGGISGISNNQHTTKNFMETYITGGQKKIYGGAYIRKERLKGVGEIKHTLTKASGQLEITLDIDVTQAKELKQMIDDAGVSSFYLGKKGLAYVSDIRLR